MLADPATDIEKAAHGGLAKPAADLTASQDRIIERVAEVAWT